jgi:hypothetical protein
MDWHLKHRTWSRVAGLGIGEGTGNSSGEEHWVHVEEICGIIGRDGRIGYDVFIVNSQLEEQKPGCVESQGLVRTPP